MQCAEFERRWQRQLDEHEDPQGDAGLRAHAAVCSSCQELLDLWRPVSDSLRSPHPAASWDADACRGDDFLARVMATVETPAVGLSSSSRSSTSPRRLASWLAVAAALVIGLVFGAQFLWRPAGEGIALEGDQLADHQSANPPAVVVSPAHSATGDPLSELPGASAPVISADESLADFLQNTPTAAPLASGSDPYPELTPDSSPGNDAAVVSLVDESPAAVANDPFGPRYSSMVETLQYVTAQLPRVGEEPIGGPTRTAWIEEVTGGLKPLAGSVSGAWNVLRQTLPLTKDPPLEKPQAGAQTWLSVEHWS